MKKFLSLILVTLTVAILLTSCSVSGVIDSIKDRFFPDSSQGENTGDQNIPTEDNHTTSYTVSIKTAGGMAMKNLPIYVFEKVEGGAGDLVDNGYGVTDENGSVTFTFPTANYVISINSGLPEGYICESFYDLSENLEIVISSSVITDEHQAGFEYKLGDVMRDFTVTTVTGEVFNLSKVLQEKKAVLINFWYVECYWCGEEFPFMQQSYEKYSDDVAIIALNPIDIGNSFEDIKHFSEELGLTFDVAHDGLGISDAFGVDGYPTSVLIDRYGVVTMIESGAIVDVKHFDYLFEKFGAEDYHQFVIENMYDFVPMELPDVEMPSSEEISNVFDNNSISGIEYFPYHSNASDDEKEESWPFIIGEYNGEKCIYASNSYKNNSYAQLHFEVSLKEGEVLAFDYFSSCASASDVLYIGVNRMVVNNISGVSSDWESVYIYVADCDTTVEICLNYMKDHVNNIADDTVYLKNLRVVNVEDIDTPTYIYRNAAKNPNEFGECQDFIVPVLGEDGYYHVNSADGPLLMIPLLNTTIFNPGDFMYNMAYNLYAEGYIAEDDFIRLYEYALASTEGEIYGVCAMNPELKVFVDIVVEYYGKGYDNEWLALCCYYDAYGTNGEQLKNPLE